MTRRYLWSTLDPDWLRRQYHDKGYSMRRIAEVAGVSTQTVLTAMIRSGIQRRPVGGKRQFVVDADWLRHQYHDQGKTLRQIAEDAPMGYCTVRAAMIEHSIPLRHRGGTRYIELDADQLREWYEVDRLSTYEIAARLGLTATKIRKEMIRHDIPRRGVGRQPKEICGPSCPHRMTCLEQGCKVKWTD